LIPLQLVHKILGRQPLPGGVLEIPGEEQIAPQAVLADLLQGIQLRTPDKEHLPHLLLQAHAREKIVHRLLPGIRRWDRIRDLLRRCRRDMLRHVGGGLDLLRLRGLGLLLPGAAAEQA